MTMQLIQKSWASRLAALMFAAGEAAVFSGIQPR
jgi:hypothetical protein